MFLPVLTHGANVEDASAGYAILSCPTLAQAPDLARMPGYRLVRNDAGCQAVRWNDGTLMAVFHAPGELRDGVRTLLVVDQPCLILSRPGHLFASDPPQQGTQACIAVEGGPAMQASLPADGTSVEVH